MSNLVIILCTIILAMFISPDGIPGDILTPAGTLFAVVFFIAFMELKK